MAIAPDRLAALPRFDIRPMADADVRHVVEIERASYQFPWSEGIFRDCLRVGYVCRVVTVIDELAGYGIMSTGAGEAHVLNLCVSQSWRCRGIGRAMLEHLLARAAASGAHEAYLEVRRTRRRSACIKRSASSRSACAAGTTRPWAAARMPRC